MRAEDTRLTHMDFFTRCLNPAFPGLEGVDVLAKQGDMEAAEKQFGGFLRACLNPDVYFGAGWNRRFTPAEWDSMPPRGGLDTEPLNFVLDHSARCDNISLPGETTRDVARRVMRGDVVSCWIEHDFGGEIQWDANPTPDGYGEWTWQLNRHHEWETLGYCYAHSGEEAYARAFRDQILSFIRQLKAPDDNVAGGGTLGWRTIEIGIRCAHSWPNAVHACLRSPSLSDHDWTLIFKSVWENANRLYGHPSNGNWLAMEMNGLVHCGVLYPFFRDAAAWEERGVERLTDMLRHQVYDDGFHYELSTNYHQVVIDNCMAAAQVFGQAGRAAPRALQTALERMYSIYIPLCTPELNLPNLNDGNRFHLTEILPAAVRAFPHRRDFLYLATARREGEAPAATCFHLPNSGMAVFRSGWEADDLWCFFESAPLGFGHQHEDKLNLLLYADGYEMITEAGRNAYDDSPRHRYSLQTQGHNAVLVDGYGQARRPFYRPESIRLHGDAGLRFCNTAAFAAAEGVYDEGFGPERIPVIHRRRILYLKAPAYADPFILVIDRLCGENVPHKYTALWHYTDHPCELHGRNLLLRLDDRVTLTTLTAGFDTARVVRGQTEPEWQGWLADIDVNLHAPIPTALLCRTVNRPLRTVTVLAPAAGHPCRLKGVRAGDRPQDTALHLLTETGEITLNENDFFENKESYS